MRTLLLVILLTLAGPANTFAQKRSGVAKTRGIAVAFVDKERLRTAYGQSRMENFEYFLKPIQEIVERDFPGVEFRILKRGEFLRLPDGTGLNVLGMHPDLGYVLSAPGKRRVVLTGPQSDADFACAAARFFRGSSPACPK